MAENTYMDWASVIKKSGLIQGNTKGDPTPMGLVIGGRYNATNPTLTDGQYSMLNLDASGRVKCILDGATISIGGDLDVDVSAFTDSSGSNVEGAMVYTHTESLAAKSDIWQGFGGWDKTGDTFRAFPISIDDSAMPATPDFVGVGGEYRAAATTYTDGDATILQTDINGYLKITQTNTEYTDDSTGFTAETSKGNAIMAFATTDEVDSGDIGALAMSVKRELLGKTKIWNGTTELDILEQNAAYGTDTKGIAVFGKYETTPSYSAGDAVALLLDSEGKTPIGKSYAITDGITSNGALLSTPTGVNNDAPLVVMPLGFNGTDWDRIRIIPTIKSIKTDLSSVGGTAYALGAQAMTASIPVTLATDDTHFGAVGSAADADGVIHGQLYYMNNQLDAILTALGGPSTPPSSFRSLTVDETAAQAIKGSAGNIHGWNIYNPNAYDVFVKFYDIAAASVVVGTTAVVRTLQIPAQGSVVIEKDQPIQAFNTAISVAATKLYTDADTTAIATDILVQVMYE